MVSGPLATMQLADQGAEVIKIERPYTGDYTRLAANRRGGFSANFLNNNRNKRSLALDLKQAEGLSILKRLAASADVFVQNFRPGVAERMGIGEASIRETAPDIIYASISGFGETGPYAAKPVYDPLIQSLSSLASIQGGGDSERPRLVRTILPDKLTGYIAAQAITAALFARERGAPGQHVRVSMLDAAIEFLWHSDMNSQTFIGDEFSQAEAASFIDLIYETTTSYISVAVQNDTEWQALTDALEAPELASDPRFATFADRQANVNARLSETQERLVANSAEYWLDRLTAYGVPCAPVLTRRQLIEHPQIQANGVVEQYEHEHAGSLRQARPASHFSAMDDPPRGGAPELGADTSSVLTEHGFTYAEIQDLLAAGTVAEPDRTDD